MFSISRLFRKLQYQTQRKTFRRELAEEFAFHEDLKFRGYTSSGLPPAVAAELTRRDMGNRTLACEESLDIRSFISLEQLVNDVRYALRLFVKQPGFSSVVILSLALGIAGNTAVFSTVNALLIKPLPYPDSNRLLRITEFYPKPSSHSFGSNPGPWMSHR